MRDLTVLIVGLLPASATKNRVLRWLGHQVHETAHIGPCLFLHVGSIELSAGAQIGTFNAFRRLTAVRLDVNAVIGTLNWFSAAPFLVEPGDPDRSGVLHLAREASITQRHYVDASGGVRLQEFALVAGVRSVFLTHEVNHRDNQLVTGPITIGRYALVSSNAKVVMGAVVPDASLVAMGAVVVRGLERPGRLYAGVPARDKGAVDGAFFSRTAGKVPPPAQSSRPRPSAVQ